MPRAATLAHNIGTIVLNSPAIGAQTSRSADYTAVFRLTINQSVAPTDCFDTLPTGRPDSWACWRRGTEAVKLVFVNTVGSGLHGADGSAL